MSEIASKVVDTMMAKDYFSQWLGIEILDIQEDYCRASMIIRKEMLNGFGILHGGVAYAFGDSVLAFAANSANLLSVTKEGSAQYIAMVKEGERIHGKARLIERGTKSSHYGFELMNAKNEIVFSSTARFHHTHRAVLSE